MVKFGDTYHSQSPKLKTFKKKVTVLKPEQKDYSIYGADLLPNHLGNLFGTRADEFSKAAITTKKRQTAKGKAENTILAGDKNYKEFAPEVSDWYINISTFEDIWKAIRREIGYYCGLTFYSVIIIIIVIWIGCIIVQCYINGFTSRETWLTIISLFTGMIRFVKYFFVLFRVIREPGQPNEQLRELAIY